MKRLIPILLLFIQFYAEAQNTMYYMERLPQSIAYNPAIIPEMKFHIGLPVISGISMQAYNSGFNFNDFDYFLDNLDNPSYNPDDFVNSIGDYNRLTAETSSNILSFGFRLKEKSYLSFLMTVNGMMSVKSASDIAYLIADFDNIEKEDFPIVIDGISLIVNSYMTLGFTYSRKVTDNLTLGITPRINFNQLGLKTSGLTYKISLEESEFDVEYEQTLSGEVQIGLPSKINPEAINNGEYLMDEPLLPDSWQEDLTLGRMLTNKSFSVDLGANYQMKDWNFSASLLNIGGSTFKTDGIVLNGNGDRVLIKEKNNIKIGIPVRLYFGAMHQFSPKWNYGLLFNNNFYNSGAVASATASLNGYIGKALSTSISYTAGYKYNNFGIGLRLRFFPGMDLYAVTDNIIQAVNFKNANRLTAAVGINISVLGNKQRPLPDDLTAEIK